MIRNCKPDMPETGFGRSVNHIPTRVGRLWPPHYYCPPPQIFGPYVPSDCLTARAMTYYIEI